jgi:hypothetical protein
MCTWCCLKGGTTWPRSTPIFDRSRALQLSSYDTDEAATEPSAFGW